MSVHLLTLDISEDGTEDADPKDPAAQPIHGHVNSISVLRSYRRLGLAKKLMLLSQEAMASVYKAEYVSLHVRKSNKAAIGLYRDTLGFEVAQVEKKYCEWCSPGLGWRRLMWRCCRRGWRGRAVDAPESQRRIEVRRRHGVVHVPKNTRVDDNVNDRSGSSFATRHRSRTRERASGTQQKQLQKGEAYEDRERQRPEKHQRKSERYDQHWHDRDSDKRQKQKHLEYQEPLDRNDGDLDDHRKHQERYRYQDRDDRDNHFEQDDDDDSDYGADKSDSINGKDGGSSSSGASGRDRRRRGASRDHTHFPRSVQIRRRELKLSSLKDKLPSHRKAKEYGEKQGSNDRVEQSESEFPPSYENDREEDSDERDEKDGEHIDILNFALTLEHVESAFYKHGLEKYSSSDFESAGYPSWVRGRYEQIQSHEETHVEFLESALGTMAVGGCSYNFLDDNVKQWVEMSFLVENVGTSAYNGVVSFLQDRAYMTVAASILGVEARHAAWINGAVRKENPWNTAFETPLDMNQAFTLASSFIVPGSCPSSNLPIPASAFPNLKVPSGEAGEVVKLDFSSEGAGSDTLYAAFITGAGTVFVQLCGEGKRDVQIPEGLEGIVYVIVTKDGESVRDETTVAGPAVVWFEFGSGSRDDWGNEKGKRR
ncbi:hypothetical protein H0H87_005694 [Tephrocybe sp. NHM501043]|nr:hypothetical protein H0H87_005694 [Tephrocybe sp. NHM501043]